MSATADVASGDPHQLGHSGHTAKATPEAQRGPASKRIVVAYGFWIFLLSDIIMFAALFAGYAVLVGETNGGPGGAELFDLRTVALETALLLVSSFACGLATIAAEEKEMRLTQLALLVTGVLGFGFLMLELNEFARMVEEDAGPQRSAFLSAFFAVVGCHGLHVSAGLLWLGTMMAQIWAKGFRDDIMRRLACFALFWHALDIIWVALFTVVYMLGAR